MKKELTQEVKTYFIEAQCNCGGLLEYTGHTISIGHDRYKYKCKRCGQIEWLNIRYPRVTYKKISNEPHDVEEFYKEE